MDISIASSAMLVDLNINSWTANVTDRGISDEINDTKNAKARAAKVTKNLFAGTSLLSDINKFDARIRLWHQSGLRLRTYSSGSIAAQRLFFAYSDRGDLTGCLEGYHDTTTGPKRAVASYQAIVEAAGLPASEILFLSDITEELDAALEAGCQTAWVVRPGNKPGQTDRHPTLRSFAEIQLS